ncbi:phosphohydrolase [Paenibacillus sp. FSL H8-0548]|nr:phosphohydrolase [Paenibacillus sp. FSL H8-0548]
MLLPLAAYYLLQGTALDKSIYAPQEHFYIVSLVSVLSLALAIGVGFVAIKLRNIKISFLSLSYVSLTTMFALHGLSTSGFLMNHTGISSSAAQLSVMLAAFWLWLSSLSGDQPLIKRFAARQRLLLPVWTVLMLAFCILLWFNPNLTHYFHLKELSIKWMVSVIVFLLNSWTVYRYMKIYLSSRFPLQLAVVYSSGWMIVAQIIMVSGSTWHVSWWLYHFLLLASVIVMVLGIVSQYVNSKSITASMKLMFRSNPQDWINTYTSNSVRELVMTTEARDSYTAGHNYRVALYALKLGEEMSLGSDHLRAIAQGGLVHDIGKLRIPDTILNKPGKLTQEERGIIELHPVSGYDLCKRLGFMPEELSVIRSHHEKWDGSGYPDRLKGDQIPLLARVTAVADVYDALTSSRSYRKAMSHEAAMGIIVEESGRHFDPYCIRAWVRLVREQPGFFEETVRSSPHWKLEKRQSK